MTAKERKIYNDVWTIVKNTYGLTNDKPTDKQSKMINDIVKYICTDFRLSKKKEEEFNKEP